LSDIYPLTNSHLQKEIETIDYSVVQLLMDDSVIQLLMDDSVGHLLMDSDPFRY
jgi:hypothetical protein